MNQITSVNGLNSHCNIIHNAENGLPHPFYVWRFCRAPELANVFLQAELASFHVDKVMSGSEPSVIIDVDDVFVNPVVPKLFNGAQFVFDIVGQTSTIDFKLLSRKHLDISCRKYPLAYRLF